MNADAPEPSRPREQPRVSRVEVKQRQPALGRVGRERDRVLDFSVNLHERRRAAQSVSRAQIRERRRDGGGRRRGGRARAHRAPRGEHGPISRGGARGVCRARDARRASGVYNFFSCFSRRVCYRHKVMVFYRILYRILGCYEGTKFASYLPYIWRVAPGQATLPRARSPRSRRRLVREAFLAKSPT